MSPSALSRLLRPVEPLTPAMSISDVADRLLMPEHRAFLSLPVVDDERRVLGLVSRYTLQDIFMQRFGRDLWGRHPVRDVMNRAPLSVSLGASLEEAAQQVTGRLQYPITEDFALVDEEGRYRGLGTVLDLLKAMEARIASATGCCARRWWTSRSPRRNWCSRKRWLRSGRWWPGSHTS